jgi:hypothetical protein
MPSGKYKNEFEDFYTKLHNVGDNIVLHDISRSQRKGIRKVLDKAVFYKSAFANAQSWAALPNALLQWISLTPFAIANFNEVLKFLGCPYFVPLSWGSMLAVGFIVSLLGFGVFTWKKTGIVRRTAELGSLQDSARFLLHIENAEFRKMLTTINDKLDRLESKCNGQK